MRFTAGAAFGTVGATGRRERRPPRRRGPDPGLAPLGAPHRAAGIRVHGESVLHLADRRLPARRASRSLSGSGSWGGFLAISPYITATNLFFQGGIAESYADRRASGSGVNARGVVAPGVQVGWTPGHGFDATLKAAWLWADQPSGFGGSSYGPEVDLNLSWSPWRWLSVLAEADLLAMGDFFPGQGLARKFILGVNLSTP